MDYSLTPEQEMVRKVMRKFTTEKIQPIAAEVDEQEVFPAENIVVGRNGCYGHDLS